MTKTLEEAIERLKQMPEDRQDSLAQLLLYEIEEDERRQQSTAKHTDKLSELVADVLESDQRGECDILDLELL